MSILLLLTLSLLILAAYYDFLMALFFVLGAMWGRANLYLIEQFLREILISQPKNLLKIIVLASIKFPVLYGVGFYLLSIENGCAWAMLTGFSVNLLLHIRKVYLSEKTLVHAS